MMRFAAVIIASFFILIEGHAQLLPATVKKPAVPKTTSLKNVTKKVTTEPIQRKTASTQIAIENKNEVKSLPVEKNKSFLKIISDNDAIIYVNEEKIGNVMKLEAYTLPLSKGIYNIKVVSSKLPVSETKDAYRVDAVGVTDLWNISLKKKEIDYWGFELFKAVTSYFEEFIFENNKVFKIKVSRVANTKFENGIFEYTVTSIGRDNKDKEVFNTTYTRRMLITDITGYQFTRFNDKETGSTLWVELIGKTTVEEVENKNKSRKEPKIEQKCSIIMRLDQQPELEPKLVELFKSKPF